MAKNRSKQQAPVQAPADGRAARILACSLFFNTFEKYKTNKAVLQALREFIIHKRANPMTPFGGKDYPFRGGHLKGYGHAGLNFDVSVIYNLLGAMPKLIHLYGIFSHDDIGTGTPPRLKMQAKVASVLDRQTDFKPLEKVDESAR